MAEMSFVTSINANVSPNRIQEQDAKLKLTEEGLQAAQHNCSAREKAAEVRALSLVTGAINARACKERLLWPSVLRCPSLKAACVSQALEQQLTALQAEMEQLRQKAVPEEPSGFGAQLQDLQAQ